MSDFFQKLIQKRRSVRKFQSKPVPRDMILSCIEAARYAPSAENIQPWRFIILDDNEMREAFSNAVFSGIYKHTRWASSAPVLIALLADRNWIVHGVAKGLQKIPFHFIDSGIAGEHLVLRAQELGLGSCWIGWFDVKKAKKFFRIPRKIEVVGLIALGYPEPHIQFNKRKLKSIEDIAYYNKWGK